jgi:asparagine synthase (glutamine-hydrolysing)
MGQKPLYMARVGWNDAIAFASEASSLRHIAWIPWEIQQYELSEYLCWGYPTGIMTIHSGVGRVAPSMRMRFSKHNGHISDRTDLIYFDPNSPEEETRGAESATETRQRVISAVQRQLVSDVPLGCFLSGGIDSSVIAAAMKQAVMNGQPVLTFSIGFDDPRYDETAQAETVAKHLGTSHHKFIVRPNAADDLPKLAAVFGEPFGDSSALPTHYLARETRQHVKVALSGDGGDELFGGYDRYRAMRLESIIRRVPRPLRGLLAGPVFEELPSSHPKSVATAMKRFLKTINDAPARRYESYLRLFDDTQIRELLPGPSADHVTEFERRFDRLVSSGRDVVQAALAIDRVRYLPDDLLTKVDRCSMLHGLEVRSPFMDHELVQFAAGLTTDQLLKGGSKRMLRVAFARDLPDFVFKRKKMGFAVPIGEWFRGELKPMLHDNLFASDSFGKQHFNMSVVRRLVDEHDSLRVDHSQRLYALLMLELWWQQHRRAIT